MYMYIKYWHRKLVTLMAVYKSDTGIKHARFPATVDNRWRKELKCQQLVFIYAWFTKLGNNIWKAANIADECTNTCMLTLKPQDKVVLRILR